jgi:VP3 protein
MHSRLKLCNFLIDSTLKPKKIYSSVSDYIFYSLGDAFENSLKLEPLYYSNSDQYNNLLKLGFSDALSVSRHASNVRKLVTEVKAKHIIGVEPNTLKMISNSDKSAYDIYTYSTESGILNSFIHHCGSRWNMSVPRSYIQCVIDFISCISYDYTKMFGPLRIEGDIPTGDSFTRATTGYANIKLNMAIRSISHTNNSIYAPALGEVQGDGRRKNYAATSGLIMCHDRFVFIGDSPGNHYAMYDKINARTCISYDKRVPAYNTHFRNQYFTHDDLGELVYTIRKWGDFRILIRVDIRQDKVHLKKVSQYERSLGVNRGYSDVDELMVHNDNLLMRDIINSVSGFDNVTVSCKLRPSYSNSTKDFILKYNCPVMYLPLPYLAPTTAEFNLLKFRRGLGASVNFNGSKTQEIAYSKLVSDGNEFISIKKVMGPLYNMYLSDLMMYLGVIQGEVTLMDNCAAMFSLSNINNFNAEKMLSVKAKDFMITYPYGAPHEVTKYVTYRSRQYVDHVVSVYHEIRFPHLMFIPYTSINSAKGMNYVDLTGVVVTDMHIVSYKQPIGVISTQYVKLISAMLKNLYPGFKELDDKVRQEVVVTESLVNDKLLPANSGYTYDGNYGSVSGHMLYVILGSMLGFPYGLNKYIKEIENNIINPYDSYERSAGSRVWHGYMSHYMAIRAAIILYHRIHKLDNETSELAYEVEKYMSIKIKELSVKYSSYNMVNERELLN